MIKLGEKVRDSITGFKGTAVAKSKNLYGYVQYQVEGIGYGGEPKSLWFDSQRIEKFTFIGQIFKVIKKKKNECSD